MTLLNPDVLVSAFGLIGVLAVVFIGTCSDIAEQLAPTERNP
jgi:arginine exporter protein ArgO